MLPTPIKPSTRQNMPKIIAIASLILAILIAASGLNFVSSYDISSTRISVIEAAIMQISHTRYLIAVGFAVISAICYAAHTVVSSIPNLGVAPKPDLTVR